MDVTISGAHQLHALSKRLKEAEDKGLKRELGRGIRKAARPLIVDVRQSARSTLPKRGGLAELVAKSKFGVRTRTSGQGVGVRLIGTSGIDLRSIDLGRVRHLVYGRPNSWVEQKVTPGFWTQTLQGGAPQVRLEIVGAMDRVARKIAND